MKLGVDVAQSCAERAGCAWWGDAIARALAAQPGVELELYHHFGDWVNGSTARGTAIAGASNVTSPLHNLSLLEAREFWAKREAGEPLPGSPDVVLATGFHAPRTPGSKLIYVVHDLAFLTRQDFASSSTRLICQEQLLLALSRAAGLVFVSEFTQREFESVLPGWLQETKRPTAVIPGASRFDSTDRVRPRDSEAPWLFVGSIEPRKNVGTLLDAYERYAAQRARPRPLSLVGGAGWKSEALHTRIRELSARLPITWRGYVDDPALLRAYAESFALVMPSWHEGFGLPVVEAMGQALPVIASHAGALPETCGKAAAALIDPVRSEQLAEAMIALDDSPFAHRHAATAGLRHAVNYAWTDSARMILEFAASLP